MKTSTTCRGPLAYEAIGGMRVFRGEGRKKVYRYRCVACGCSGENDGKRRRCGAMSPRE